MWRRSGLFQQGYGLSTGAIKPPFVGIPPGTTMYRLLNKELHPSNLRPKGCPNDGPSGENLRD